MVGYLVSFHYFRKHDIRQLVESSGRPGLKLFADSGAFSAHTTGTPIVLEDYAEWIKKWSDYLDPYVNLDVTFDYEQGKRNLARLKDLGLDPTPVWHVGDPLREFEAMAEEYDFVAIGNMVARTKRDPKLWAMLDAVHGIAGKHGTGLHGFGLSSWPMIVKWPWRSVDSSSMGAGFRYGRVSVFDFYSGRWVGWKTGDEAAWYENGWLLREYGFEPAEFAGRTRFEQRLPLMRLAGATWAKADQLVPGDLYLVDSALMTQGETRIAVYEEGVQHQLARDREQQGARASRS